VIGVDADATSMRAASARVARRKTAIPNALFVVAAVESLPTEIHAVADRITINFPWGSLLRGVVEGSSDVLGPIARAAVSGAEVSLLFSIEPRDVTSAGVRPPIEGELSDRWTAGGFDVVDLRPAWTEEIAATGSSWAKRLRASSDRSVVLLRAVRR
jgi:16S rRNA (adenine(1408)-N(1))-methyltransferase